MVVRTFLTAFDDRLVNDGSIDPLGATVIWTGHARRFISNLTTVTTSSHDFFTVLAAIAFGSDEKLGEGVTLPPAFLRFEQLAAYTRERYQIGQTVRGVRMVKKRLATKLLLSKEGILSNQRAYGLWGYYTGPTAKSGLIKWVDEGYILLPTCQDLVVKFLTTNLTKQDRESIARLVANTRDYRHNEVEPILVKLKQVYDALLHDQAMVSLLRTSIAKGQTIDDDGSSGSAVVRQKQSALYSALGKRKQILTAEKLMSIAKKVEAAPGCGKALFEDLMNSAALDHVLIRASQYFDEIRSMPRQIGDVAALLDNRKWLPAASPDLAYRAIDAMAEVANAQSNLGAWNSYLSMKASNESRVHELLRIHERTVNERGGSSWVQISGTTLHPVKMSLGTDGAQHELHQPLAYGFFIPSMMRLKEELQ